MKMEFNGPDGELVSGDVSFVSVYADICRKHERQRQLWILELRANGIKAAHPDDGWVDRKNNSVVLMYPQFDDGVSVGDKIALGWPDKHRIVEITGIYRGGPLSSLVLPRFYFIEL